MRRGPRRLCQLEKTSPSELPNALEGLWTSWRMASAGSRARQPGVDVHGSILRGLLSRALAMHRLPKGLVPFACEAGHVHFPSGTSYAFSVTFFGECRRLATELADGLARVGGARAKGAAPVLGGNFVVDEVQALDPPDPGGVSALLAGREKIDLLWRSPLRLRRPEPDCRRGAAYFDRDFFPGTLWLDRLWRRLFELREGRFPDEAERAGRLDLPTDMWIIACSSPSSRRSSREIHCSSCCGSGCVRRSSSTAAGSSAV